MSFRPPNSAHDHSNPELGGTPDSSGRRCQIHLAQCSADHPTPPTTTQTQARRVIPSETRNPAHAGAPDSSGRWCRIHSAQRGKPATLFHRINPAVRPVETGVPTGL
ncbi:MAG: hypothetical protein WCY21_02355 [Candidatus Cloacimonadaceae bacterium]|nr:hypothetical protein [Candidatus Cloacimonadota bacterium]